MNYFYSLFFYKTYTQELNKEYISRIPIDALNIILEYDGKIKYRNGKYINCINVNDYRYNIIQPIINKKIYILKNIEFDNINKQGFYFEVNFNKGGNIGLVYDYNFSYTNVFEICYYNWNYNDNIIQIRTYI